MTIRKLTTNDFDEWKQVRLEAVKNQPESFGESYNNIVEQDSEWFKKSLANGTTFAKIIEDNIAGLAGTFTMKPGNMKHRAVLFGLYVKPEHRGKKIAEALINHIIEYVKPYHTQLQATVTTNNEVAIALYKKHGFEIYGTDSNVLLIDGSYYDEYLMLKTL